MPADLDEANVRENRRKKRLIETQIFDESILLRVRKTGRDLIPRKEEDPVRSSNKDPGSGGLRYSSSGFERGRFIDILFLRGNK